MTNSSKNHEALFELLPLYVNSSLNEQEKQVVDKHLQECELCQKELILERSIQESMSIKNVDVSNIAQRNLAKFNAQLDQHLAVNSQSEVAVIQPEQTSKRKVEVKRSGLLDRLMTFGRSLSAPTPAFGGALALGCCAIVVLSILSTTKLGGYDESQYRGCEHVVQRNELHVTPADNSSIKVEATDIVERLFPESDFTVTPQGDNNLVVVVDGDVCVIPVMKNELEKLTSVKSVIVK